MPYVNVRILDDRVTTAQKQQIIRGITQVMVDVLGKRPAGVHVVIDEVPLENWGSSYKSVAVQRAERASEEQAGGEAPAA